MKFLFLILLLTKISFAKQPDCDKLIGFVQIGQSFHVNHPIIDDEAIDKVIKNYLKILDPEKEYLTSEEVSFLLKKSKNDYFLEKYYKDQCMFLDLVEQKVFLGEKRFKKTIKSIVPKKNVKKEIYKDFAKNEKELIKRIKLKYENVLFENPKKRNVFLKRSIFNELKTNRTTYLIKSFYRSFDPHSDYLTPVEVKDFESSTKGSFTGFGFVIDIDSIGVKIVKILDGGTAQDMGIEAGDYLTKVNGKFFNEYNREEFFSELDKPENTSFTFDVLKKNKKRITINIKNKRIEQKDTKVSSKIEKIDDKTIFVVKVPYFYQDDENKSSVSHDFLKQYKEAKSNQKIDGIILDLRNNLGGLVDEVLALSGYFIGPKVIFYSRESNKTLPLFSLEDKIVDEPTVVLTNEESASASEILAGAFQDYKRALIIGESKSTFGKGTVQSVLDHFKSDNLGLIKITIAQFYLPNGMSTQKKGVSPDILVEKKSPIKKLEGDLDYALDVDTIDVPKVNEFLTFDSKKINELSKNRTKEIPKNSKDDLFLKESILITNDFISMVKDKDLK